MAADRKSNTNSQSMRRIKFGLNVLIAVIVATALVVLCNVIAYRQFVRFDFTATRQYSLSKQTLKLIKSLEKPYKIVTLLPPGSTPELDRSRDLVDEYARYSNGKITVEHLEVGRGISRLAEFYKSIAQRYETQLKPLGAAVDQGRDTLTNLRKTLKIQTPMVQSLSKDEGIADADVKEFINNAAQALARLDSQIETVDGQIKKVMDDPLPDLGAAKESLSQMIKEIDEKIYAVIARKFENQAQSSALPNATKEKFLEIVAAFKQTRSELQKSLEALKNTVNSEEYDKVRGQFDKNANAVVLIGPTKIQVLGLEQMFRQSDPNAQAAGAPTPELRFLGEELITGAMLAMNLDNPPLVVFVASGRRPALGPQGEYQQVANRLKNMNFKVEEWNPMGRPGPMGQPSPPAPAPEPKPGQKAVWILLPAEPSNPMMGQPNGSEEATMKVMERLAAGDSAMLMPTFNPMSMMMGGPDPTMKILEDFGISAQTDRIVLREETGPRGKTAASNNLPVDHWPQGSPITSVLAGVPAIFLQASPLILKNAAATKPADKNASKETQTWPLVQIDGKGLWAERNLSGNPQAIKRDPATAADQFIVGAAAEKASGTRLVVIADPAWATDQITNYGQLGANTAEMFGAAFPGNAELFVNSIYWLSSMDQFIGAGARSQDIRRIGAVSDSGHVAIRWGLLAGLPLVILLAGLGVWVMRRSA